MSVEIQKYQQESARSRDVIQDLKATLDATQDSQKLVDFLTLKNLDLEEVVWAFFLNFQQLSGVTDWKTMYESSMLLDEQMEGEHTRLRNELLEQIGMHDLEYLTSV